MLSHRVIWKQLHQCFCCETWPYKYLWRLLNFKNIILLYNMGQTHWRKRKFTIFETYQQHIGNKYILVVTWWTLSQDLKLTCWCYWTKIGRRRFCSRTMKENTNLWKESISSWISIFNSFIPPICCYFRNVAKGD